MKYVVMDLEMCNVTKSNRNKNYPWSNETIQIGAVLLNDEYEVTETFNTYVSPKYGTLDAFITSLTGITNKQIKGAPSMNDALKSFLDWVPADAVMVSWSTSDLLQLKHEAKSKQIDDVRLDGFYSTWIDCQRIFGERADTTRAVGLEEALMNASIDKEGHAHNGLDDALNTAKLFAKLQTKPELKISSMYSKIEPANAERLSYTMESLFAGLQIQYA